MAAEVSPCKASSTKRHSRSLQQIAPQSASHQPTNTIWVSGSTTPTCHSTWDVSLARPAQSLHHSTVSSMQASRYSTRVISLTMQVLCRRCHKESLLEQIYP